MKNYQFVSTKEEIINFLIGFQNFEQCFLVRNIFSRFAIYVVKPENIELLEKKIKEKFEEWVDVVENIDKETDSFIYKDLSKTSENTVSTKVFFAERHAENTNWFIRDRFKLNKPVISFYSFKGGVGRTTATILVAILLARKGKKVLLVDFDLEAPGLASIFANQSDNSENLLAVKGVVDFMVDYEANKKDLNKLNLDDYYFVRNQQVLVGINGGELIIVPAIATDNESAKSYIDKLSKTNIKYNGQNYVPDIFLKKMEEKIKPDYILIDTRTGINDVGGLVFNRYAQSIFLIFYGNQQNMFGLESILPQLKNLNRKEVNFYLVNSPVPKNETDRKDEINYFVEKSYEIFCNYFYDQNNIPAQNDETADHFPINIPFNDQALILNNYKRLTGLLEHSDNTYQEIADIIRRNYDSVVQENTTFEISNKAILDCIIKIDKGAGTSEIEYQNEEDLIMYFYPRKDYKYIFDKDKFLVLGEKGVGKTALFSVLSHSKYAIALANFCGISNEEIQKTEWVIGLEKDNLKFPDKANFDALSDFTISQLRNYWLILLIKQLSKYVPDSDMKKEIMNLTNKSIKDLATRKNIGEDLYELLSEVNTKLSTSNKTLIIVYDHLDAVLSNENHVRGRLVSALLSFYYDNYNRFSQIKAKIFLRNDIFNREVNDITDKVKIQNYAVEIKWDYNQLLNIIWKRIYEQDKILFPELQNIGSKEFSNEEINKKLDILGNIPNLLSKEEHEVILHKIFGKRMGGNNKTYPYNWLRTHTEDTNNQIHPRTLIRLFSESAKLQSADNEQPKDGVIRSKNIETALKNKVSKQQIQELGEEYPEFREIFANLVNKVENGRSPMNENNLIRALEKLNIEDAINTIEKLKEIGLLKEYKAYAKTKVNNEEKRYHIPDLYLSGLGFTRLGTN